MVMVPACCGIETSLLQDKAKIFMAMYYCVRLHALFEAALAAGLVVARMAAGRYGPKLFFLLHKFQILPGGDSDLNC